MVSDALYAALGRQALPGGVVLVHDNADETLAVEMGRIDITNTIESWDNRAAEYVQRIDNVLNPRIAELERYEADLAQRERHLSDRLRCAQRERRGYDEAEDRAQRDVAQARQRMQDASRQRARELEQEAAQHNLRAALLATAISQNRERIDNLRKTQGSSQEIRQLEQSNAEAQRDMAEAQRRIDNCFREARQLMENPPESDDVRRANTQWNGARDAKDQYERNTVNPLERELRQLSQEQERNRVERRSTPKLLGAPVTGVYQYRIAHHLMTARGGGELRLNSSNGATIRRRIPLSGTLEARDTSFPGASVPGEPGLNIPTDPLQLPSPDDLTAQLATYAADQALQQVWTAFSQHADRFVTAAQATSGDEQLHQWVLAYYARNALSDASTVNHALTATRNAGFDLETNALVMSAFDNARP